LGGGRQRQAADQRGLGARNLRSGPERGTCCFLGQRLREWLGTGRRQCRDRRIVWARRGASNPGSARSSSPIVRSAQKSILLFTHGNRNGPIRVVLFFFSPKAKATSVISVVFRRLVSDPGWRINSSRISWAATGWAICGNRPCRNQDRPDIAGKNVSNSCMRLFRVLGRLAILGRCGQNYSTGPAENAGRSGAAPQAWP